MVLSRRRGLRRTMNQAIVISSLATCSQSLAPTHTAQNERGALKTLYDAMLGGQWKNTWDITTDPCIDGWYGIRCTDKASIKSIELANNNLVGQIPEYFGRFPNLEVLDLGFNNIGGSIPDSFKNLPSLQVLKLAQNRITGPIPDFFANYTALQVMEVSFNQFEGDIPDGVKALSLTRSTHMSFKMYDGMATTW